MKSSIRSVKGTREFYPEEMALRNYLYRKVREASESFGFQEWDGPFIETMELYAAKSGEELVKKQSFVFEDRGGDLVTLRPELTPSLARMIDLMTVFIKIVLVSIVLVSVMNVMVMAVYERIREIGTIAAIGTPPSRILALFLGEGLLLGLIGTAAGTVVSLAMIYAINLWQPHFAFGQQQDLVMAPTIAPAQVVTVALLVMAVAVLASLQPAWKASRLDPINALRHV